MATMERPKPKVEVQAAAPKKLSAEEAVQELEQRLAALGGPTASSTVATKDELPDMLGFAKAPPPPPPPVAAPPIEAKPDVKGGKNALLARIMAAQNKAKETAPPSFDLLGPPPPISQAPPPPQMSPPPAYDVGLLGPPPAQQFQAPPPAFDLIEDNIMAHQPPPPQYVAAPPAASAPSFEDLLGGMAPPQDFVPAPPPHDFMAPPPHQDFFPAPPPPEEEIIMGMEGLSPEERRALMEEQRKIMEQIEREKNANASAIASAQADNFDMRSTSNAVNAIGGGTRNARTETGNKVNLGGGHEVALHGPERTKEAIKDGTAILVQCVNCENWMQVTGNATLMYCPVCAVVSPIDQNTAAMTKEEAMQMEADRKLAESLQSEEYEKADRPARRPVQPKPKAAARPQEESWWDTVTSIFSGDTSTESQPSPAERQRTSNDERASLVGSSGGGGGGGRPAARVAQSQPLFSCVVDSVNSTMGTLTGAQLGRDAEGNVHGVDSTSLLAVSNVGRDTEYSRMDNN